MSYTGAEMLSLFTTGFLICPIAVRHLKISITVNTTQHQNEITFPIFIAFWHSNLIHNYRSILFLCIVQLRKQSFKREKRD